MVDYREILRLKLSWIVLQTMHTTFSLKGKYQCDDVMDKKLKKKEAFYDKRMPL